MAIFKIKFRDNGYIIKTHFILIQGSAISLLRNDRYIRLTVVYPLFLNIIWECEAMKKIFAIRARVHQGHDHHMKNFKNVQ